MVLENKSQKGAQLSGLASCPWCLLNRMLMLWLLLKAAFLK
jgi:hypothetical protein